MSGWAQSLQLFLLALALPLQAKPDNHAGTQACARCHAAISHEWAESLHSKMLQPATEASVKGDFAHRRVTLRGSTYLLQHHNNKYYITESVLSGKTLQHRLEYTLGDRRIQQYLTTMPDGRIIVLPPTWDI